MAGLDAGKIGALMPLGEAWQERWTPWRDLPTVTWSWWQNVIGWLWRGTAAAFAIGIAKTLVGLLTGVQFFRLITPGSLFANLLLIPAAMLATLDGFASLLCELVGFEPGLSWCNPAAALFLCGIEELASALLRRLERTGGSGGFYVVLFAGYGNQGNGSEGYSGHPLQCSPSC